MKLKEYCEFCYAMGEANDKKIMLDYIQLNNMEEWAIKAMALLASSQVVKLEKSIDISRTWSGSISWIGLTKQYGLTNAERLANWQEYVISRVGTEIDWDLLPQYLKDLEEIVPTIEKPLCAFFRNAIDELHKHGIYFKDEEK